MDIIATITELLIELETELLANLENDKGAMAARADLFDSCMAQVQSAIEEAWESGNLPNLTPGAWVGVGSRSLREPN